MSTFTPAPSHSPAEVPSPEVEDPPPEASVEPDDADPSDAEESSPH